MKRFAILTIVLAALIATPAAAQATFSATPILQSRTTAGGAPIAYPKTDSAEVTALKVEIAPGGETGRHMHPNPTFVYVLAGAIDVEMDGGVVHSYKAGDSYLEDVNTWHNTKNKGTTPAQFVVVFAGVHGKPNLVRPS